MGISSYQAELRAAMRGRLVVAPGVAAVIRNDRGWVLVEQRTDNGLHDLPAGAVDPGETPREALIREVREETGLEVQVTGIAGVFGGEAFRHTYQDGQRVEAFVIVFDCVVTGGTLHSVDGEAGRFQYRSAEEMPALMWPYPAALFDPRRTRPVVE